MDHTESITQPFTSLVNLISLNVTTITAVFSIQALLCLFRVTSFLMNLLSAVLPSSVIFFMCCAKSLQSYSTLCNPMDCSPPGSSVHGILQARILE